MQSQKPLQYQPFVKIMPPGAGGGVLPRDNEHTVVVVVTQLNVRRNIPVMGYLAD